MTEADRDGSLVTVSQIADLADVGPSAVSNWRKRFDDFPQPSQAAPGGRDLFGLDEVELWLAQHGRLGEGKAKRLLFAAADRLRSEVSASQMAEVLGATLALVAYESKSAGPPRPGRRGIEDLLEAASPPDPALSEAFRPLLGISQDAAEGVLELILGIEEADFPECFEWILSRHRQPFDTQTSGNSLTSLLEAVIGETSGTIYDPAAGSGGFLLGLWRQTTSDNRPQLFGQELDVAAARIARQRFLIEGVPASLVQGDSLITDAWPDLRAEVVVCDPPYGAKKTWPLSSSGDPRWLTGQPPAKTDFAWLQHVVYHLSQEGRGYVFLAAGSLFRRGKEADLRRELLAEGVVEAIVGLPPGSVPRASIPVALWILRRPGRGGDRDSVLMIDATVSGASPRGPLNDGSIARIALALQRGRAGIAVPAQDRGMATSVPVLDLLRRDANLAPARWMSSDLTVADRERQESEFLAERHSLDEARTTLARAPEIQGPPLAREPRQWIQIEQLLEDQVAEILQGVRIKPEDYGEVGTPVVRTSDVTAEALADEATCFVDLSLIRQQPVLTLPGDVILSAASGRLAAVVDRGGGRVLAAPLQGLRLLESSMDPAVVAAFLESPRNRRFASGTVQASVQLRDLEIPVLPFEDAHELRESLEGLRELERLSDQVGTSARTLRTLLLSLASSSFAHEDDELVNDGPAQSQP